MATLLLRLAGPMQSWGSDSKFETRRTDAMPTKSGVIGLLAAALGLKRDASLEKLSALRFGVRADQPGHTTYDFQLAHYQKSKSKIDANLTYRYFIEDGIFLVGLESDDEEFLKQLDYAVRHPIFHLSLGRKSYVPTQPISLGICKDDLESSLKNKEWLVSPWRQSHESTYIEAQLEAKDVSQVNSVKRDQPKSFDSHHRQYGERGVYMIYFSIKDSTSTETHSLSTEHDIFEELD